MAITFGGTLFAWDSASEIVLWVMVGVLLLVFGTTQRLHPLVSAQHKLYPTVFLKDSTTVMLQVAIFMSSLSLFIG